MPVLRMGFKNMTNSSGSRTNSLSTYISMVLCCMIFPGGFETSCSSAGSCSGWTLYAGNATGTAGVVIDAGSMCRGATGHCLGLGSTAGENGVRQVRCAIYICIFDECYIYDV